MLLLLLISIPFSRPHSSIPPLPCNVNTTIIGTPLVSLNPLRFIFSSFDSTTSLDLYQFLSLLISGSHHPKFVFLFYFVSIFCNLRTFCVIQQCYFYWINEKVWGFDVICLRESVVYMFCCWELFNCREGATIRPKGLEGCKQNTMNM